MKIKQTRVFKEYALNEAIKTEAAMRVRSNLTMADGTDERRHELTALCLKNGWALDGVIIEQYYIDATIGVVYELPDMSSMFRFRDERSGGITRVGGISDDIRPNDK